MQISHKLLKVIPFILLSILPISGKSTTATDVWCDDFGVICPDVSSTKKLAMAVNKGFDEFGKSNLLSKPKDTDNITEEDDSLITEDSEVELEEIIEEDDSLTTEDSAVELEEIIEEDDSLTTEVNEDELEKTAEEDSFINDTINSDVQEDTELPIDTQVDAENNLPTLKDKTDKIIPTNSNDNKPIPNNKIQEIYLDELGTSSTISLPVIKCPSEPELKERDLTLRIGDKPITQHFLEGQKNINFVQFLDGSVITLLKDSVFYEYGGAKIIFEARDVGETELILGNCFEQAIINFKVLEELTYKKPLQSSERIKMNIGETRILWFTGGQEQRWLSIEPDNEVITLDSLGFPIEGGARLELIAHKAGTTKLAVSDRDEQAIVDIEVTDSLCEASQLNPSEQDITLILGKSAITKTFIGDDITLIDIPDDEIIQLDLPIYSENNITQLTLTPRQVGKTKLSFSNCASTATIYVNVIKQDSLADFCNLDGKTDGICESPSYKQSLIFNSLGTDTEGNSINTEAYFEGFINTGLSNSNLVISQTDTATAYFNIIVDKIHNGLNADIILYAERKSGNNKYSYMYNGRTWQNWDGDLANLMAIKQYDYMPSVLDFRTKLDALLQNTGEFVLNVGYRLNNGDIIFGEKTAYFWVANSSAEPSVKTRAYFSAEIQRSNKRNQKDTPVVMKIKPDSQHIGKKADIILVVNFNGNWYMQLPNEKWHLWNGNIDNLATVRNNVTLTNSVKLEVSADLNNISGRLIYIGYRISDNKVIFNGMEPIKID